MVIASEDYIKKYNLTPLAEIIAGEVIGVDPTVMGIGPVPAINQLLKKQKLNLGDIDLFEINEAFAPQVMACQKALEIPSDKLNIWGGALALGHPLGATGIKITLTLARQMQQLKKGFGISKAFLFLSIILAKQLEKLSDLYAKSKVKQVCRRLFQLRIEHHREN